MKLTPFSIIVALDEKDGIGLKNTLPWKIPAELARFKEITSETADGKKNVIIMGRNTWDSLSLKPLPGRYNIVLSRNPEFKSFYEEVNVCEDLYDALDHCSTLEDCGEVFVIGGSGVYRSALRKPFVESCKCLYVTRIHKDFECDARVANFDSYLVPFELDTKSETQEHVVANYHFEIYVNKRMKYSQEYQYLDLIEKVLKQGKVRGDRTGTGTISLFGERMEFDISESFPMLTTKKVYWKGVGEELLWMLRGQTDVNILDGKNVKIWNGNTTRKFLDSIGLNELEEMDAGAIYGFQWRHFGASYRNKYTDYTGLGFDQIKKLVKDIKEDPNSRRIILTAWNPPHLHDMCLPPCHLLSQFYVDPEEKTLSCQLYMRSNDLMLGAPFNIASYSLLTYMLAKVCDLTPGKLVYIMGDAHIYSNHVEGLREQLKRDPRPFPTLNIKRKVRDPAEYEMSDFELTGYKPHKPIKMKMAV